MGPNICLFDRPHLCDKNGVGKIFHLFFSYKYYNFCLFFYILRQKNRKNHNICSIKIDIKFFRHDFHRKAVLYQIKIYLDPYLLEIIDSGPICTFTFAEMVAFSRGPPLTCDHFFSEKNIIQILDIPTVFHLVFKFFKNIKNSIRYY